jgi:cytosolic carboxypeptidase protein 2/3
LRFEYAFAHLNDEVEFCTEPPYALKRLSGLLLRLPFKAIEIGKTVMGHTMSALMVNDPQSSKAVVVVMARQHPGESVGSWLMEGFLSKLKNTESSICWLIVPMVNIDGVLLGNNRTGLLGYDFNRNWNADEDPNREHLFPEIAGITRFFKRCRRQKHKQTKLFLDLHGHSSEPNVFSYGPPLPKLSEYYENSRLFPFLMSRRNPSFKLGQCGYELENAKKNCARAVFFNKLGFPYSYTIESSFGIYNEKPINEKDIL